MPCAPLRIASSARPCAVDRAVGIALAELAFGLAHGLAGLAELIHVAVALLALLALLPCCWPDCRGRAASIAPAAC